MGQPLRSERSSFRLQLLLHVLGLSNVAQIKKMSISTLSEVESGDLECEISYEEIKAALWSLKATKASGSNGLFPEILINCWGLS